MKRITQNLFEEIQKITSGPIEEKELKHDEDKDGDEDAADYMMKRRKAGGQSHAQAHAATRKHNEEVEIEELLTQEEFDSLSKEDQEIYLQQLEELDEATSYALIHSSSGREVDRGSKDDMVKKRTDGHHVAAVQKPSGASTLSRLARKFIPGQGQKQAGERARSQEYSAKLDKATLKHHPDDKRLATTMKSSEKAQKRYERISRGEAPFKSSSNDMKEEIELGEGITETIIKHNDFVLEITNNPTFADFLNAAKSFVDNEEDAVVVAEAFYANNDESIIIEAFTRSDIESKVDAHRKAGHSVTMPKYSTKEGKPYAEYVVSDKETKVRRRYIHHGDTRRVENMGTPGKKDKGEE